MEDTPQSTGVATWYARAFRKGEGYHIVVEGLLELDVQHFDEIPEATRRSILNRLHQFLPERTWAVEVPGVVWLGTFSVEVRAETGTSEPESAG